MMRHLEVVPAIAVAATTAVALAAPTALAQSEPLNHPQPDGGVTLRAEPAGVLCPAVSPSPAPAPGPGAAAGGCRVHASGANIVLIGHVFGVESIDLTCNWEFDARLDGHGEGYLTHVELTQGTQGTCTRRPCGLGEAGSPEGRAWSAYLRETAVGVKHLTFLFCIWGSSNTTNTHCELSVPVTEPTEHRYRLSTPLPNTATGGSGCHGTAGFRGELVGQWNTEAILGTTQEAQTEQQIEIDHTTPGV